MNNRVALYLLIILLGPNLAIVSTAQDQDASENSAEINLSYDDQILAAVRDPTAMPDLIPLRSENIYHSIYGNLFKSTSSCLFDANGEFIEISNITISCGEIISLTEEFTQFSNGSIFSFKTNSFVLRTEVFQSNQNYTELANYQCSIKLESHDYCWQTNYGSPSAKIELERYLVVYDISNLKSDFESDLIIDIITNNIIFEGEIYDRFASTFTSDYMIFETNSTNYYRELLLIEENGEHYVALNNAGNLCISENFIHGGMNGSPFFYDIRSKSLYNYTDDRSWDVGCSSLSPKEYIQSKGVFFSVEEYYDYKINGIEEVYQLKVENDLCVPIDYSAGEVQNNYFELWGSYDPLNEYRFIRCDTETRTDYKYFDTQNNNFIILPHEHRFEYSNENYVSVRNANQDCFIWNTNTNKLTPIIVLSYSPVLCSTFLIYNDSIIMHSGLSLIDFNIVSITEDGKTINDNVVEESAKSDEKMVQPEILSVLLFLGLIIVMLLSKRNYDKKLVHLQEIIDTYDEELSYSADYEDENKMTSEDLIMQRANKLFPEWSKQEIKQYLQDGWTIEQLLEWKNENR